MIGILTETLLGAILAFFLLGVTTYLSFILIRLVLDCCFTMPGIFSDFRRGKRYNPNSFFNLCKNAGAAPISWDVACAITVTVIGFLYCLFTYIFLDGVLRILPFIALLLGIYILNISLGKRFVILNKYIKLILTLLIGYPFYFGIVSSRAIFVIFVKIKFKLSNKDKKTENNV